ncbi:hypothetical protein [Cellulomonas fimi]|uniref:hypothetical protein n=1 Tax=Cellulomonas fimi TaxID=1708 RepID=UPI002892E01F|nr:hypothetical protein [Cellulomonas fimi]
MRTITRSRLTSSSPASPSAASPTAVLIGRTSAPGNPTLTQHDAVLDALGGLGIPVVADVDFGHVPPQLSLVNGAQATVTCSASVQEIEQTLA